MTNVLLQTMAAEVARAGLRWALLVPPDGDAEWAVRLGRVECVSDTLDGALDIALDYLRERAS